MSAHEEREAIVRQWPAACPEHVALWDAIHEFAAHSRLSVGRQRAVVKVERTVAVMIQRYGAQAAPCEHIRQSREGTAYCALAAEPRVLVGNEAGRFVANELRRIAANNEGVPDVANAFREVAAKLEQQSAGNDEEMAYQRGLADGRAQAMGDAAGVKRVKVARELVAELRADWSQPVQVKVDHEDRDGDLVLLFKSLPPAPDDAAELAALREAVRECDAQREDALESESREVVARLTYAARALLAKRDGQGVG